MIIDGTYFNEDNIFSMKIFYHSHPIDNNIYYTNDDNTLLLYNDFLYNVNGIATNTNNDVIDFIYENLNSNNLNKETISELLIRYKHHNPLNQYNYYRYSIDEDEDTIRKVMDLYNVFISNIKQKHELNTNFKLEIHYFNMNIVSSSGYIETLSILNIEQKINLRDFTSDSIKDIINFNPEITMEQLQKKYFKTSKKQLFN